MSNTDEVFRLFGEDGEAVDRWVRRCLRHRRPRWRRRRARQDRSTKFVVECSARGTCRSPRVQRATIRAGQDPWAFNESEEV